MAQESIYHHMPAPQRDTPALARYAIFIDLQCRRQTTLTSHQGWEKSRFGSTNMTCMAICESTRLLPLLLITMAILCILTLAYRSYRSPILGWNAQSSLRYVVGLPSMEIRVLTLSCISGTRRGPRLHTRVLLLHGQGAHTRQCRSGLLEGCPLRTTGLQTCEGLSSEKLLRRLLI